MANKYSTDSELRTLRHLDQRLETIRRKAEQLKQVTPSLLNEKHAMKVEKFLDSVLRKPTNQDKSDRNVLPAQ
jgi:regulator of replication initiation timing